MNGLDIPILANLLRQGNRGSPFIFEKVKRADFPSETEDLRPKTCTRFGLLLDIRNVSNGVARLNAKLEPILAFGIAHSKHIGQRVIQLLGSEGADIQNLN